MSGYESQAHLPLDLYVSGKVYFCEHYESPFGGQAEPNRQCVGGRKFDQRNMPDVGRRQAYGTETLA